MTHDLRFRRVIDAPPEVVFDAFTRRDGQRAFYGQDDPGWIVQSDCDLRVGGVWTVAFGPSPSQLYRHTHVFEAIERPRRLIWRRRTPRSSWSACSARSRPWIMSSWFHGLRHFYIDRS